MGAEQRTSRQYSESERRAAVALTTRVGPTAASRECGIPMGTLSFWTHVERQLAAGRARSGAAVAADGPGGSPSEPVQAPTGTVGGTQSEPRSAPPAVEAASPTPGTASAVPAAPTSSPAPAAEARPASATAATTAPSSPSSASGSRARVARKYTPSERARALERMAQVGVRRTARELRISPFALRDWRRKAQEHAAGKRTDNPLAGPDTDPAVERDRRILAEWKSHPGLGPTQVRNQLRRASFKVSVHTVRRVLEEHGYVAPKSARREVHDQSYEAVRPNQLWHLDFVNRHIHKQSIYVLLILDDFSRFIVGAAIWDAERAAAVLETFEGAVARHGKPEAVMSDGGSAFWSWRGVSQFTRFLEELDVDQIIAKKPQTNGKIEALNANIHKELFNPDRFFDLAETARRLAVWVEFYNLRRTNTALGGLLVPADRYFGRVDRVLAEIEAGRPADGTGEPLAVAARELDFLRVTSRGGQVEVFLMGAKLWPAPAGR